MFNFRFLTLGDLLSGFLMSLVETPKRLLLAPAYPLRKRAFLQHDRYLPAVRRWRKYSSIKGGLSFAALLGGLRCPGERKTGLLKPPLEHRNPIIAPELFAAENADRDTENLIG